DVSTGNHMSRPTCGLVLLSRSSGALDSVYGRPTFPADQRCGRRNAPKKGDRQTSYRPMNGISNVCESCNKVDWSAICCLRSVGGLSGWRLPHLPRRLRSTARRLKAESIVPVEP